MILAASVINILIVFDFQNDGQIPGCVPLTKICTQLQMSPQNCI